MAFKARIVNRDLNLKTYPQLEFAQPKSLCLRAWGDALNLLGKAEEAENVFKLGVEEKIWKSHVCRSVIEYPMIDLKEKYRYF